MLTTEEIALGILPLLSPPPPSAAAADGAVVPVESRPADPRSIALIEGLRVLVTRQRDAPGTEGRSRWHSEDWGARLARWLHLAPLPGEAKV